MTRKERVETVRNLVASGVTPLVAIQQVAQTEGVLPARIIADIRSARWLLVNDVDFVEQEPHDGCPLLISTNLPADVIMVRCGWSPEEELARQRILNALGVGSYSALPTLFIWIPEHYVDDGEGGQILVPKGFRERRITRNEFGDRSLWNWKNEAQVVDRLSEPYSSWALRKQAPPDIPEE